MGDCEGRIDHVGGAVTRKTAPIAVPTGASVLLLGCTAREARVLVEGLATDGARYAARECPDGTFAVIAL